jgi:hypothetical protein
MILLLGDVSLSQNSGRINASASSELRLTDWKQFRKQENFSQT